ncbi:hypothetical protein SAMN05421747_10857 [Parapedobacter composti]|uniref:Uncharacterized protein n=1 Tax=Parapedobacter composti TaxID=623281 RepID=A0A1I1I4W0_9SPHI|nr:hypothetical protein SAMN05421747_10857 [Parapedobacter composti]
MIVSLLILIGITIVTHLAVHYFLFDLLAAPFNVLYYKITNGEYKWNLIFYFLCLVLVAGFSYLFLGVVSSYLSWITIRHPNSLFMKIAAITFASGIVSRFKDKSRQMTLQDISYSYIPSVYAAPYISLVVFIFSIGLLLFPELMVRFWSWAPFVNSVNS